MYLGKATHSGSDVCPSPQIKGQQVLFGGRRGLQDPGGVRATMLFQSEAAQTPWGKPAQGQEFCGSLKTLLWEP